jgi:hypothetical protein
MKEPVQVKYQDPPVANEFMLLDPVTRESCTDKFQT